MVNQANMPHLQDALESMLGSVQPDIARILDKSLSGGEVSVDEGERLFEADGPGLPAALRHQPQPARALLTPELLKRFQG